MLFGAHGVGGEIHLSTKLADVAADPNGARHVGHQPGIAVSGYGAAQVIYLSVRCQQSNFKTFAGASLGACVSHPDVMVAGVVLVLRVACQVDERAGYRRVLRQRVHRQAEEKRAG